MQIEKLDHVNIRTTQLDVLIDWYESVLGMRSGDRPNFPFPGAWMYAGDTVAVHLVGIDSAPGAGSDVELKLEHFAFSATGRAKFEENLRSKGENYRCNELADIKLVQYNVWDPDGNHIHVDFVIDE